jgi:2-dehydro-3-deoxy-D-arabinonate dehydratase
VQLTRHQTKQGARWAMDRLYLPPSLTLSALLELPRARMHALLATLPAGEPAVDDLLAPIDPQQEVWAAGVTYLRSREARRTESTVADLYDRVYAAERPELFFKAIGWRVVGTGTSIRIRADSRWNVPEPELVCVINGQGEIVGYSAGNDVSSRDIEGENPLYLPQAKVYDGSCAIGNGILLCGIDEISEVPIRLQIEREGEALFAGETTTAKMKRTLSDLVENLTRELGFPQGVFLMTGTGIVPGGDFTLLAEDVVTIQVGPLTIKNRVADTAREQVL